MRVCVPFAYSPKARTIILDFTTSGSIFRVTGLFTYPKGASVNHSPRRSFWRIPRFTFSTKLSEKYLDCPNATCNMNLPCGVGSNQNYGRDGRDAMPKYQVVQMNFQYTQSFWQTRLARASLHFSLP